MIYLSAGNQKFNFSYQELKEQHIIFCEMSDKEFMDNIAAAAHFAAFVCYIKEIPTGVCLADDGIVHELLHLIHIPDEPVNSLKEIRELFKNQLLLA